VEVERETYTIKEAAEVLGVSANSIYDWTKEGTFPCVRMGTRVLINRTTVEKILSGELTVG
jgi:excisionase family DNA binding protein